MTFRIAHGLAHRPAERIDEIAGRVAPAPMAIGPTLANHSRDDGRSLKWSN